MNQEPPFLPVCRGKIYFPLDEFKNGNVHVFKEHSLGMCNPDKKQADLKHMERMYAKQFETLSKFTEHTHPWYAQARARHLESTFVPQSVYEWVASWHAQRAVPGGGVKGVPADAYTWPVQKVLDHPSMTAALEYARFVESEK